jgi:hypothetical protein
VVNCVRDQLRQSTAEVIRLEYVFENTAKIRPSRLVRIDRHCSVTKIQRSYIVKPKDMINMAMRYQNRVEKFDIGSECLLTEIGRRID